MATFSLNFLANRIDSRLECCRTGFIAFSFNMPLQSANTLIICTASRVEELIDSKLETVWKEDVVVRLEQCRNVPEGT